MAIKKLFLLAAFIFFAFDSAYAQKTNDAILKQIKSLKAEKTIELSYDESGNTSKIMVRSENFDGKEAGKTGIQAMNFGMAFFYAGTALQTPPETIALTFWVLTKKPQFAAAHNLVVALGNETLDLGDARYAARPGESMEYLNFKISRADLAKIAAGPGAKFRIGTADFTFSPQHLAIFRDLLAISSVN
ncbi:hypothetical protein BH10ACI2_BH10ACI2_18870 [soil metagenome]